MRLLPQTAFACISHRLLSYWRRSFTSTSPRYLSPLKLGNFRKITMTHTPPKSFYRRELPSKLVELSSTEGKARFKSALESGTAEAFFPLVSQMQTQSHPASCGLTTLTTVLNALEIDPKRVWAHPWRWFAESLLECCLNMEAVKTSGITMDQLARTAGCQGSAVDTYRGLSVDDARQLIKKCVTGRPDGSFEFLVASYDRGTLGQTGSGHFSPVAALDINTDSALVLDVARFKYSPYWVDVSDLVEATRPIDKSCGLSRGFMTFRKLTEKEGTEAVEPCESSSCDPRCKSDEVTT